MKCPDGYEKILAAYDSDMPKCPPGCFRKKLKYLFVININTTLIKFLKFKINR